MLSLEARLPAGVHVLSGLPVPQQLNTGGRGPAAYRVAGLRIVPRELANQLELIIVSDDFAWTCIFSHEAEVWVDEQLYECDPND
jgi:hypothetical protein